MVDYLYYLRAESNRHVCLMLTLVLLLHYIYPRILYGMNSMSHYYSINLSKRHIYAKNIQYIRVQQQ